MMTEKTTYGLGIAGLGNNIEDDEKIKEFVSNIKGLDAYKALAMINREKISGGLAWHFVCAALVEQKKQIDKLEADLLHTITANQRK
jgi:hypothetical protein